MKTLNVFALATELRLACDAYYNGTPTMTDAKFDAKENELRKADPHNSFFTNVGAPVSGKAWHKVAHQVPMGSLNKAQNLQGMTRWSNGRALTLIAKESHHNNCVKFVVMEKLDGISISLRYENSKLVQAVTRGNGTVGEDIFRNVKLMNGVPHTLPKAGMDLHVRGEIVCLKSDFAKHFPGESNPRNTASGTAKRQSNASACKHLTVVAFDLQNGTSFPTRMEELGFLTYLGFQVTGYTPSKSLQDVEKTYQRYVAGARERLDYEIDGLVVALNDKEAWKAAGERNHRPAGSIAYKFPHESAETILRKIVWQVGSSGRVTPVAEFDSVLLAGANVRRASLHNVSNVQRIATEAGAQFLNVGDTITVSRRNDVIPYVESLESAVRPSWSKRRAVPANCPVCKSNLVFEGEYLVCKNSVDCDAQVVGALGRWVKKVGVLDWGGAVLQALAEDGLVSDPADLYKLDVKTLSAVEMSGRRVGSSSQRMLDNLNAKKELPLSVVVGSLGISLMGRSMVQKLVDGGFDSLSKLAKASIDDLARVPGMGQTKAEAFYDGFKECHDLIFKLMSVGVTIQVPVKRVSGGALSGKTVCMTGFRDADMQAAIESVGGTVKSGVSQSLSYLVAKDPHSTSGKAKKARENGTVILGVDEMWNILGGK